MLLFNPRPKVEVLTLAPGRRCVILDDVLLAPEALVDWAAAHRFDVPSGNLYPGLVMGTSPEVAHRLRDFVWIHARAVLGLRRCQDAFVRLSLSTIPTARLHPLQWMCHQDRVQTEPGGLVFVASVLYLFREAALGGTSFFEPRLSAEATAQLMRDAETQTAFDFSRLHGLTPGYPVKGNRYFDLVATVPPAWNRMIIYDGGGFHSAAIAQPDRLTDDAYTGRLTLNGFFPCRPVAS
jgi:hypothetical protein